MVLMSYGVATKRCPVSRIWSKNELGLVKKDQVLLTEYPDHCKIQLTIDNLLKNLKFWRCPQCRQSFFTIFRISL